VPLPCWLIVCSGPCWNRGRGGGCKLAGAGRDHGLTIPDRERPQLRFKAPSATGCSKVRNDSVLRALGQEEGSGWILSAHCAVSACLAHYFLRLNSASFGQVAKWLASFGISISSTLPNVCVRKIANPALTGALARLRQTPNDLRVASATSRRMRLLIRGWWMNPHGYFFLRFACVWKFISSGFSCL
jgi:hypothetical protein